MLPAVDADGRPPYKAVVTHGFVVDEKGEKMAKSLGNFISVEDALGDFGAELQRLWSASVDYTDEIPASGDIIRRMEEPYRRFRNTFRFLLGNLHDFDPSEHRVEADEMREVDRFALSRLQRLIADVREAYDDYRFYRVYQRAYGFCTVELSAFYLNVVKDRLYCEGEDSAPRRAAQTVMHEILGSLTRLLAPILVHTAEEVWDAMPGREDLPSVHLALLPQANDAWTDEELEGRWERILAVRDDVARELEMLRAAKEIGDGLDATVTLCAEGELLAFLRAHEAHLPEALIVSEVTVFNGTSNAAVAGTDVPGLGVVARPSERAKCVRCWRLLPSVGSDAEHPELCERCVEVVRALASS
jgi:isoleucyl-tRNA synthetase